MSIEEENKAVARRVVDEVFNQGNMSILSECIDSDYIYHGATGECRGPDALGDLIAAYRAAFPDIHATIEEMVAEGDTVALRMTIRGTFRAEFMGLPPTGKRLETMEEVFIHFHDGKEVEAFPIADGLTFFHQLGIPFSNPQGPSQDMSTSIEEDNKAIVRRVFEAINEKNWAVLDEVISTDCLFHGPWGDEEKVPQLIKRVALMMYNAFPDQHFTIEDIIVEGNKVVTRATVHGTHKSDFMGIAPTGKQFTMTGIWIYYIADGKIIEDWEVLDQLGMMQQLGAITS